MKNKEPWSFCKTPKEKCTMNYCDDNGCQNRKRNYVEGNDLIADVGSGAVLEKPTIEKYGWHTQNGFDDEPSGWMYEGGEEAYYEALKKWEAQQ